MITNYCCSIRSGHAGGFVWRAGVQPRTRVRGTRVVRYVDWLGKPVVDVQRRITPFLFDDNRAREMNRWRHISPSLQMFLK